jgi:hypothetical protein
MYFLHDFLQNNVAERMAVYHARIATEVRPPSTHLSRMSARANQNDKEFRAKQIIRIERRQERREILASPVCGFGIGLGPWVVCLILLLLYIYILYNGIVIYIIY